MITDRDVFFDPFYQIKHFYQNENVNGGEKNGLI